MNRNDILGQANYPIVIWLNHNLKKKKKNSIVIFWLPKIWIKMKLLGVFSSFICLKINS